MSELLETFYTDTKQRRELNFNSAPVRYAVVTTMTSKTAVAVFLLKGKSCSENIESSLVSIVTGKVI